MYTDLLFDLDGTLIDSQRCILECLTRAFPEHGLPTPPAERIVSLIGVPLEASLIELEPKCADDALRGALIETYRAHYRALSPSLVALFPGIADLLRTAHARGQRIAIVTSKKSDPARMNLEQLGIAPLVHVLVGSDMVARYKPHPESALLALALLERVGPGVASSVASSAPRRAIVVGDASFDLQMGHAAGVHTCAVTWGAHAASELAQHRPTHTATTVDALARVLALPVPASAALAQPSSPARTRGPGLC